MADKPKVLEVDCSTGISIEREMTSEEIANMKAIRERYEADQAEATALAEAKATAKASALAKLAALGLTEEEAAALAN